MDSVIHFLPEAARDAGAVRWGTVSLSRLAEYCPPHMALRFDALRAVMRTAVVMAFPYFAGRAPGNISLYARGMDYYTAIGMRLSSMAACLSAQSGRPFRPLPNAFPLPAVQAGRLAGLGFIGRNGLLICPPYGSFIFLGALVTDLDGPGGAQADYCRGCLRCVDFCPTQALSTDERGGRMFRRERCLSHLSQRKTLTDEQSALFSRHAHLVWGCDLCQLVCPENDNPQQTTLPEFLENRVTHLGAPSFDDPGHPMHACPRAFLRHGLTVPARNFALIAE